MNNSTDHDLALRYVAAHNVMSIATTGPDGLWNTALFYVNDGFDLFFVSDADSRHCRNMLQNDRVAVTIQEDYSDWKQIKGVQMSGTAQPVSDVQLDSVVRSYRLKFAFLEDEELPGSIIDALHHGIWYRMAPRQIFYIDNHKGFGYRSEISPVFL
jgi:hypothetical protein